jgi:hypothetical protein
MSLPSGTSTGCWTTVQEDISDSEYELSRQDDLGLPVAYQASNRAQNLRTYLTPNGFRAKPRTGDGAVW